MPVLKLNDKKETSDSVVAGIRLTKSKYVDPSTVKIDLRSLKEEERLKVASSADNPENEPEASELETKKITKDLKPKPVGISVDIPIKEKPLVPKLPKQEAKKSNSETKEITQDLKSKPVGINVDIPIKEKPLVPKPPKPEVKTSEQSLQSNDLPKEDGLNKESKVLKDLEKTENNKERKKETMPPNEKPFAGVFGKNEDTSENKNTSQEKALSDSIPKPKKTVKKSSFFGKKKKKVKPIFKGLKKTDSPIQPAVAGIADTKEKDLLDSSTEEKTTNKSIEDKASAKKPMPSVGTAKITPSAPKPVIAGTQSNDGPVVKPVEHKVPGAKPAMPPKVSLKTPEKKPAVGSSKITPSAPKPVIAGTQSNDGPVVKPVEHKVPGAKPAIPPKVSLKTPEKKPAVGSSKITSSAPKPAIAGTQSNDGPVVKPVEHKVPGAKPAISPKVSLKTPEKKPPMGASKSALKPGVGKQKKAPSSGIKPKLQQASKPKPVQDDSLLEPTANIPAYATVEEATSIGKIKVNSLSNANLFCFYKKNNQWQKEKFAPEPFGVKVGKSSNASIKIDDPDISDIQLVFTEIIDIWVVMDCGENDMMRVDGYPARQIKLSPNLPYVIQIGDNSIALFLSDSPDADPELIPPAQKLGLKKDSAMKLSKIKIGEKQLPLHIPESLKQGDDKIISGVPAPSFVLTPLNDPDKLFAKIEISADTKETTIGRSSKKSQIVVPEKSISRQHAKLELKGKTLVITDCDTSNGTFINAKEISGSSVAIAGDIVSFGNMPFMVSFE